ncbi:hypothetical protein ENUP19_0125G0022 [Entamoeba nuttalli]|uniref:Protein kinase domain-containing protein n=2 Tax=Entamoeba nuttalli TaxID=412467 RepID=K2H8J9_ENTNP|nr:hypothetical protein ENU1_004250 [Entamoeba nuttalli P19]EKE42937.1 hypothetical protein ENU1_004250 [Entamoeba nuttalli P19]|eukprot:XP_008854729.1 hypothetical protein ENU1_004250 [Entamoeba nuttalli P19]
MECVKRFNNYIYHTYPQVYFNTLDHCYYQFVEVKKEEFNKERIEIIEKCNSPYLRCYMNESNKEIISIRFSLIKAKQSIKEFCEETKVNGEIICKIFLELIDAIVILHKNGSFHGNLNEETIFIDNKEYNISIGSIGCLNGEYKKEEMMKKDYEDIGIVMIKIISKEFERKKGEEIIKEIKEKKKERIEWVTKNSNELFTSFFMTYLNESSGSKEVIKKWISLQEIISNKEEWIEVILGEYIEYYYNKSLKDKQIEEYVHMLQPFLLDNLRYNIKSPNPTSNSQIIFIDSHCNIINLNQLMLTRNSFEFITTRNNTIIKYNLSNKEENEAFAKFIKTQTRNEVINQEIILPNTINDNLEIIHFSKPLIEIKLYCDNPFKLLYVANQLRSCGHIVKCQRGTDDRLSQDERSWHISILNEHQPMGKQNGEINISVRTVTGDFIYELNDFIKLITMKPVQFHSTTSLIWGESIRKLLCHKIKPKIRETSPTQASIVTIPKETICDEVIRVKSCQILN